MLNRRKLGTERRYLKEGRKERKGDFEDCPTFSAERNKTKEKKRVNGIWEKRRKVKEQKEKE